MKLTKIVATIGPVSESEEIIEEFFRNGVNIFRFNLKHNTLNWHKQMINKVREVSKKTGKSAATLIDLQGPEIRISLEKEEIEIKKGEEFVLGSLKEGKKGMLLSHPLILKYLKEGQKITIDDGRFEFTTEKKENGFWLIKSESEGILKTRKTLNIPGIYFPIPVLEQKDIDAIKMGAREKVDFVALSFVRNADDVKTLKKKMQEFNSQAKVVSKIETKLAIDNLDQIIKESDVVMVARGDLGVELPLEEVPFQQKRIIRKCLEIGIPVITATQMLASMVNNPIPTRAEISDVANAVYDFTDCVMLSEETALGKYPQKAVRIMEKTVKFVEEKTAYDIRPLFDFKVEDQEEIITDAAYNLFLSLLVSQFDIAGFIVFTQTGRTVRKLSRYRPKVPIFAFTPTEEAKCSLIINFAVFPCLQPETFKKGHEITKKDITQSITCLKKDGLIEKGKYYVLLHGDAWMTEGKTSTIKLISPENIKE